MLCIDNRLGNDPQADTGERYTVLHKWAGQWAGRYLGPDPPGHLGSMRNSFHKNNSYL